MAPQATPKHMTDEELRQQYGIQLASRPLEGGDSNQAKWADLEDEDEDWAPETLEWSDGTKINLAPTEPATPANLTADQTKIEEELAQPGEDETSSIPKPSLGPKATVLKLGGGVMNPPRSPFAAGGMTTGPKSGNEKPTLVAKPSPAPPAKSPWAQLPPVEKVSPIATPVHTLVSRFPHRESYNRDPKSSYSSNPAREIAADDYSRFPANGTSRELFNSQSGRYEPAPESRRLSMKKEGGFRTPAVLQRPSQSDVHGPTESSPASQHSRTVQDTDAWRRRRASSNVSNDSRLFTRRMSMTRPGADGFSRRDSIQDHSIASGYNPYHPENLVSSPAISHGLSVASQQSPMTDHVGIANGSDQQAGNQIPGISTIAMNGNLDADLARQKKMMREKAEAAMKRRKEEEAREEAEKRERLRLKLQQLEPKKVVTIEPLLIQASIAETTSAAEETLKATSPPKPPVPSASGEPQQYGLMKVHSVNQPLTNVGADGRLSQLSPSQDLSSRADTTRKIELETQSKLPIVNASDGQTIPRTILNPVIHQFDKDKPVSQTHRLPSQSNKAAYQGSVWGKNGMSGHSSSGVNVWAAPGSQKTLGNGDFHNNIAQIHLPPSQQYPQHLASSQTQPQPIGTPRQTSNSRSTISQNAIDLSSQAPSEFSSRSGSKSHPQIPSVPKETTIPVKMPAKGSSRYDGPAAWVDFTKNVAAYEAKRKAETAKELAKRAAEEENAEPGTVTGPRVQDTWIQVVRGETPGDRRVVKTVTTYREPTTQATNQAPHMRSRYKDLFDQTEQSAIESFQLDEFLTPPPEERDHPVYDDEAQRPKVRLPGSDLSDIPITPTPIVRLPPADAYHLKPGQRDASQSPRLPLSPLRQQPLVNNTVWQERFKGLLGTNVTSQKELMEMPGFSMSKEPLEHVQIPHTSVSLPPQDQDNIAIETMATKNVEDEIALLEEGRDFGSVPSVHLPYPSPFQAWNPPRVYKDIKRIKAAILTDEQVHSRTLFSNHELIHSGETSLVVKLPAMENAKRVAYAHHLGTRPRQFNQGGRGGRGRNSSGQHNPGNKTRDPVGPTGHSSPTIPSTSSGRAHYRGSGQRKPTAHGHNGNWSNGNKRHVTASAVVQ